jgi:hypothetical protein
VVIYGHPRGQWGADMTIRADQSTPQEPLETVVRDPQLPHPMIVRR